MKTLFLRIFLSFWAAMVLVMLTTTALAWYRYDQIRNVNIDIRAMTDEAVARLLEGGEPAVARWIDEAERKYKGRRIYVIRPDLRDVRGQVLPQTYQAYIWKLQQAGLLGKGASASQRDNPLLMTPLFADRSGTVYTLLAIPRNREDLLFAPDVSVILLVAALLASGFVCWWLARYVSKPVERLQMSTRSLAAGNMDVRVGEDFSRRHDELGVLARDFDTMADQVRNLLASKESLLRAMSHELRSPLARLRVASGLARRRDADIPRQLDRIDLEAERLDTLIGQMLQLSHLRTAPVLPAEPLDLPTLLSEVVEDARLEASAADKRVEWSPGPPATIDGDHDLLRSAIENVLRNAVRFTAVGSAVQVTMTHHDGQATIVIEDRGPGVPEAELSRIFEPFYRVAESRDRDSGGTGLGLAITQRVVRLYGGEVQARNGIDGGLRVEIRLPVRSADLPSTVRMDRPLGERVTA